jgi:hypothetical protein
MTIDPVREAAQALLDGSVRGFYGEARADGGALDILRAALRAPPPDQGAKP